MWLLGHVRGFLLSTGLLSCKAKSRVDTVSAASQIVDRQRNPPHLMSEMASALLIRLALPDLREKGQMAVGSSHSKQDSLTPSYSARSWGRFRFIMIAAASRSQGKERHRMFRVF